MSSLSGGGPWKVDCSQAVTRQHLRIQEMAARTGRGQQIDLAILRIRRRLTTDPDEFGEPTYNLPALRLQLRQAIVLPLAVHFAVSLDRPIVYIKGVRDLQG